MDNYARALEYARKLFMKWDQQKLISRCRRRKIVPHSLLLLFYLIGRRKWVESAFFTIFFKIINCKM